MPDPATTISVREVAVGGRVATLPATTISVREIVVGGGVATLPSTTISVREMLGQAVLQRVGCESSCEDGLWQSVVVMLPP